MKIAHVTDRNNFIMRFTTHSAVLR